MILAETIFVGGAPVGVVRQDTNSRQIVFFPIDGKSPLPNRPWKSVDELRAAVVAAFSKPEKDESPSD